MGRPTYENATSRANEERFKRWMESRGHTVEYLPRFDKADFRVTRKDGSLHIVEFKHRNINRMFADGMNIATKKMDSIIEQYSDTAECWWFIGMNSGKYACTPISREAREGWRRVTVQNLKRNDGMGDCEPGYQIDLNLFSSF